MLLAREQETNEAKAIYADYCNKDLTKFDEWQEEFEESWQGKWDSMEDFTIDLVDSSGLIDDIPDNWKYYFDYAKFGRDLLMDGYWEVSRHIFRDI
jgi:antirestriction protein